MQHSTFVVLIFLQILSASEGNILEDESAILVITEAKSLGNEISSKQKIAEETEVQIEAARTAYKPCGDYTAILFFCISGIMLQMSAAMLVHTHSADGLLALTVNNKLYCQVMFIACMRASGMSFNYPGAHHDYIVMA